MAQARLFTVTQWLLNAAIAVCLFGGAVLSLALGALALLGTGLWMPADVAADLAKGLHGASQGFVFFIAAMAVATGIAILALAILIFWAVRQIVDSATHGDPFVTANADRLARIGWLLVAIYAAQFGMRVVAGLVPAQLKEHMQFDGFGPDFSPLGVLAILLIFVLAQIFRHGSQMRAELEGTV